MGLGGNSNVAPKAAGVEAKTVAVPRKDFYYRDEANQGEPHSARRKAILAAHPEIETLYGSDMRPLPFVFAIIASQLAIAYYQKDFSVGFWLAVCWVYGGAANHALSLMTHELAHNLVFPNQSILNDVLGIVCNMAMGVPSATMFKRYHMEHHIYQGDHNRDTDLPTHWEGRFFTNTFLKCIWLLCQPLFYALRPTIVHPKTMNPLDVLCAVVVLSTDAIIAYHWGVRALAYLVLSTLLGMGFHPVAGHFISEHYVFTEGQETYSYYGALNLICWNVGYHNEHHDFPKVPGWRLPQVRAMAPEFYDSLHVHNSWTYVLWQYLTDPAIGPYNRLLRVKRDDKKQK